MAAGDSGSPYSDSAGFLARLGHEDPEVSDAALKELTASGEQGVAWILNLLAAGLPADRHGAKTLAKVAVAMLPATFLATTLPGLPSESAPSGLALVIAALSLSPLGVWLLQPRLPARHPARMERGLLRAVGAVAGVRRAEAIPALLGLSAGSRRPGLSLREGIRTLVWVDADRDARLAADLALADCLPLLTPANSGVLLGPAASLLRTRLDWARKECLLGRSSRAREKLLTSLVGACRYVRTPGVTEALRGLAELPPVDDCDWEWDEVRELAATVVSEHEVASARAAELSRLPLPAGGTAPPDAGSLPLPAGAGGATLRHARKRDASKVRLRR